MLRSYLDDPALFPATFDLLDEAFPGLADGERIARTHGLRWESISTPFLAEEAGRVIAHVGVLRLPLVIAGRRTVVGGIHAVATRTDRRGRGLAGTLLAEAVSWAEQRHETLLLTAGEPGLYERSGFRVVPEVRFFGAPPAGTAGEEEGGLFDWGDPQERARLEDLLVTREPVSRLLGAAGDRDVFLFHSARARLRWIDSWGGLLWLSGSPPEVRIVDVVARRMPRWQDLARALPAGTERVELCFTPDVVGGDFCASPPPSEDPELLMVRGPFPPEGLPVCLSPATRC